MEWSGHKSGRGKRGRDGRGARDVGLAGEEQYLGQMPVERESVRVRERGSRGRRGAGKSGKRGVGRNRRLTERKSDLHRAPEARRARAVCEVSWPRLREEFADARWSSQKS